MYIMKEEIRMANKCRERCSSRASVIKEMQIKITTKDLHMQVRMTTIRDRHAEFWQECADSHDGC